MHTSCAGDPIADLRHLPTWPLQVLVAGNVIMNSSVGVHVADDNHTTAVALVNNTAVIS